jgi:hypothetical protein
MKNWKIAAKTMAVLLVVGWWALGALISSAPTIPDQTHTIAANNHGTRVYITVLQHHLLYYFFPVVLILFIIGAYKAVKRR